MEFISIYPLVNIQKAMEHGPFIVDLHGFTNKHVDFPMAMLVYQRVLNSPKDNQGGCTAFILH